MTRDVALQEATKAVQPGWTIAIQLALGTFTLAAWADVAVEQMQPIDLH